MEHAHVQHTIEGHVACGTCHQILVDVTTLDTLPNLHTTQTTIDQAIKLHQHETKNTPVYTSDGSDLDTSVLGMMESFSQITSAIAGYRQQLLDHGIDEQSANDMTVDYHRAFITHIFKGMETQ